MNARGVVLTLCGSFLLYQCAQRKQIEWKGKNIASIPDLERLGGIIKKIVIVYICFLVLGSLITRKEETRRKGICGAIFLGGGLLAIELISRIWQKIIQR